MSYRPTFKAHAPAFDDAGEPIAITMPPGPDAAPPTDPHRERVEFTFARAIEFLADSLWKPADLQRRAALLCILMRHRAFDEMSIREAAKRLGCHPSTLLALGNDMASELGIKPPWCKSVTNHSETPIKAGQK